MDILIYKTFGEFLRENRKDKKISLRKLEELTEISFSHLSKIERGEYQPSRDSVISIAEALELDEDVCMIMAGYAPSDLLPTKENVNLFKVPPQPDMIELPIVGTIRAGMPIERIENIEGTFPASKKSVNGHEAFWLRVKGESMAGDEIHDGDLVLVIKTPEVLPSEIAVVAVNGDEATLKRVKCEGDICVLTPSNNSYETQIYPANIIQIIGKTVGFFRNYKIGF